MTVDVRLRGMIPVFPDIMVDYEVDTNTTECMCSDLQTEDYSPLYAKCNLALIIFALPPLSLFGVCTNIANVYVYSRKRMQNSANTYLLFLACSDFLVILTGLFIFWIDSARSYIPELARAPYTTVYTLPFGYMAQTCSIYFTVAAAFDCYINVCWKSQSKDYCTIRRAKQICSCIVVVSIMYNSLRFPQFNLRKCFHETSGEQIIEICPTSLFFTINMVYNVYMYMVLMTLLPFLFLLCLNAIIVFRQSLESNKQKEVMDSSDRLLKPKSAPSGGGDDTITMIMVVILFLACNTLALIVNVIETFFEPDPILLNLLSDASNFLVVFNSSVNCVIYFVFNNEYREIFLAKLHEKVDSLPWWLCCCLRCCIKRHHRQDLIYQPVASDKDKEKRQSLRYVVAEANADTVTTSMTASSPVWQPLTQRHLPNMEWPAGCYDPSAAHLTLMDDDDSGWDDGSQVSQRQYPTRWLAEVNIVDGQIDGQRPHIVVKPISSLLDRETISITAL
ncbi:7 transmembrane receptor [Ancylostoma caninum]|uniref:7 transmembrane receptor n=2 Tax=Ancylostoma TaxID=29169 RepID=A0A368FB32_ANCCA|nr:7 transmembrane receptor [Ancylostoma caninum]